MAIADDLQESLRSKVRHPLPTAGIEANPVTEGLMSLSIAIELQQQNHHVQPGIDIDLPLSQRSSLLL